MSTNTTNFGLEKPLGTENYDIEVQNRNMDKLDANLKAVDKKASNITVPVTKVNEKIGDVVLTASDIGAETPTGAQAKVDALAGDKRTTETVKGNADAIAKTNENVAALSKAVSLDNTDMTKHVTKDGALQTGLNAEMVGGKKATNFVAIGSDYGNNLFENNDLNVWTKAGMYSANSSTANVPNGSDGWGTVFVIVNIDSGRLVQTFQPWNSGDTYFIRRKNNGTWSAWSKILTQADYDALFQYANKGKTAVASAITAKGVSANSGDTFSVLATKVGQISITGLGGLQHASGSTMCATVGFTVAGLTFQPRLVMLELIGLTYHYVLCVDFSHLQHNANSTNTQYDFWSRINTATATATETGMENGNSWSRTSTGFTLAVTNQNLTTVNWEAVS